MDLVQVNLEDFLVVARSVAVLEAERDCRVIHLLVDQDFCPSHHWGVEELSQTFRHLNSLELEEKGSMKETIGEFTWEIMKWQQTTTAMAHTIFLKVPRISSKVLPKK